MAKLTDTLNPSTPPEVTPRAKMLYLIKRKPTTSREELVAHWYANHMPLVIQAQHDLAAQGKPHARRYIVTLFDANEKLEHPWDGMAQLWWDRPLPMPKVARGTTPSDTFQQKVEPYVPWVSTEYVVMEGLEYLKVEPLTLNEPFPCTRSGFYKVSFLVKAKESADFDKFQYCGADIIGPLSKYALADGDILFNRTNSKELVGKTGLWCGKTSAVIIFQSCNSLFLCPYSNCSKI